MVTTPTAYTSMLPILTADPATDQPGIPVRLVPQTVETPAATTDDVSSVSNNGVLLTVKQAAISVAASGSNQIVAAVTGKSIVVLSYTLVADAAVTAKWRTATAGADLSGAMSLAANGGVSAGYNPKGHVWTTAGDGLFIVLGGAVGVRGHLTYVER